MIPQRPPWLPVLASLLILGWATLSGSNAGEPKVEVESGIAQLFVDDYLIDVQTALKRTLRQPRKDDGGNVPVLSLDQEFGDKASTLLAHGTILRDPRLNKYVMFAIGFSSETRPDKQRLYRFTSNDGLHWTKGDDGTPEPIELDMTDSATGRKATYVTMFSGHYDIADRQYPYKAWMHFANWGELSGQHFFQSSDGKKWKRGPLILKENAFQLQQDGRTLRGAGDNSTFYHDAKENRFLALIKFLSVKPVGSGNLLRSRAYAFFDRLDKPFDLTCIDRVELVPPATDANGDLPDDEYYSSTAWRYESLWLGGLRIWHGGGNYPYSAEGSAFLKLLVSRDGLHWKKVTYLNDAGIAEVFIPNGPEGGNNGRNDGGYHSEFNQGPLRMGDELIYYYGCSSYGKRKPGNVRVSGGGIFRARLRPDGFVSVDGGTLTTKPLRFSGKHLFVNGNGSVQVDVLGFNGKTLASSVMAGDSLRHQIIFQGKSLRQVAGADGARLRFTVNDGGQLYSFKIE